MMLHYVGRGAFIPGVPAQDIPYKELGLYAANLGMDVYTLEEAMLHSGLYSMDTPTPAEPDVDEEDADGLEPVG
jgi:hypothetical protein